MQGVIVYRNPLEAQFWHSMMNGGFGIFVLFVVCMLVTFLVTYYIISKSPFRRGRGDWIIPTCLVISAVVASAMLWFILG